jgi:hypothetical protein
MHHNILFPSIHSLTGMGWDGNGNGNETNAYHPLHHHQQITLLFNAHIISYYHFVALDRHLSSRPSFQFNSIPSRTIKFLPSSLFRRVTRIYQYRIGVSACLKIVRFYYFVSSRLVSFPVYDHPFFLSFFFFPDDNFDTHHICIFLLVPLFFLS